MIHPFLAWPLEVSLCILKQVAEKNSVWQHPSVPTTDFLKRLLVAYFDLIPRWTNDASRFQGDLNPVGLDHFTHILQEVT